MELFQTCPICQQDFSRIKYINTYCTAIDKKISFIESICNNFSPKSLNNHCYLQIEDLYGLKLYERIDFYQNFEIEVNYIKLQSNIFYHKYNTISEKIPFNKVIELDFPHLNNVLSKIKTLRVLL